MGREPARGPRRTELIAVVRAVTVLGGFAAIAVCAVAAAGDGQVNNEAEIRHTMELEPPAADNACKAVLELEYYQRGHEVRVNSTLTNPDCGASSGTYSIEVRLRDDDGNTSSKKFDESWTRDDDEPITLSRDYPVGDGIDVLRVRPRKLRCECTVEEAAPEPPALEPQP